MALRILFVPWNIKETAFGFGGLIKTAGSEYMMKNNEWIDLYRKKQQSNKASDRNDLYQAWYSTLPNGAVVLHPLLTGLQKDDQVYVRGHCEPYRTTIFSEDSLTDRRNPKEVELTPLEVAKRLRDSGLRTSFTGTVKCYNCNSFNPKHADGSNFSSAFVKAMDGLGFTSCRILGYFGSLDSFAGSSSNSARDSKAHKQSALKEEDGFYKPLGRASENRFDARTGKPV
jgi:hypothetical protein